jgi:hypothetical protein
VFVQAVERKILNIENGTYWDNVENEMIPISDALEKGYIKGRKVDSVKELEELSTSQAEVVKSRLKKVAHTVGALAGFRKSQGGTLNPAN